MSNVLEPAQIRVGGIASSVEEAIAEAAGILVAAGAVTPEYQGYMLEREKSVSTYMGNLLAIPHGTNEGKDTILDSALSFVRYDAPIDWAGNEVRFVVGIAGKDGGHLEILSKIAIIFSDDDEVQKLLDAPDAEALYALLAEVNEA
ncbi:PTS sugar transporter subunit IIA [Clavibacter sepedonicus]|uniref:Mannitol-specific phosphotransferase enzyme IIA component n=1 Tax=Clavibacter sepedonicus TaxID=31964 RepID=B0RB66_CLASE|nr:MULTISPECIES: PTS sugar transporter subunit IIA [Clavibacter]MBD5380722.1 PTS sugar transporter subunit IIA [Clavibacter sp.]OQJ48865.1 PTS mannitol transporter subunit IIA [Clavibacter sepedonicus]OQJ54411.1 PTS mannitol transporter subunit IIA [Clavibacter sepedonicus]UUK65971.1 PTS sugar transporter subunit IIA [Clavibacter sepedonicus]CAQ00431.1 PTS system, phosphotransferase enzyme II, A component [Clavibacter sepedonicus]